MIIVMKPNASDEAVEKATNLTESRGLTAHLSKGSQVATVDMVGDKTKLLDTSIETGEGVDKIMAVTESYKLIDKKFHPEDSVIPVDNTHIGPDAVTAIANPCTIESLDQLLGTTYAMKEAGAIFLRGNAYKSHASPYLFQGLEEEGLKYMKAAREVAGLNVICEVTNAHTIESTVRYADILQIGARNMQSFELLKEAGKPGTPVLLKRGLCATIDEWLDAVKYIVSEDNPNVVLRGRGIRTYGASVRDTLDINAVPVIRQRSHLPIAVGLSHVTGVRAYVELLAKVATAIGANGLMIEVHPCPAKTLSDGPQSLTFDAFEQLMRDLAPYAKLSGRTLKAQ